MCIERGPIIHSRSQKSHCRLPFFLQRTRDPVSSSSSWSSSSSSSSFYPVTLDHANRSPTLFFSLLHDSSPTSSFSRSFFPFLPKARATSASKHDDRPMMDRRIVDSPPPLPCTGTLVKSRLSPTQLLFRDRARDTPFHRP